MPMQPDVDAPSNLSNVTPQTPLPEAFYLPRGNGVYDATHATMSPWNASAQHGGPPAALLARLMSDAVAEAGLRLGRLTVDFLAPIPRSTCEVEVIVTRPGRRISRTEATLTVDGTLAVTASAWHIATPDVPPTLGVAGADVPPLPDEQPQVYFSGIEDWGYGQAIEWRFVTGSYVDAGPAAVWGRPRIPLIAGREITGQDRAVLVADSANGVSNELPIGEWLFIPPTMTYTALREPEGEWVLMDATTTFGPSGGGMSFATIQDERGLCANVAQPLLVSRT